MLLPKSSDPSILKDYRPIVLIHSVRKFFSKVLANRLAPRLGTLAYPSQSRFIKGHFIQDNFRYVQASAKSLNARRHCCLHLKMDISGWPFLLEIMQRVGFTNV
jgi:hypothetical protein